MVPKSLDGESLDDLLKSAEKRMLEDKRNNFRIVCLSSDREWEDLLDIFRERFSEAEQGQFIEFSTTYSRLNQEFEVYLYLFQHADTGAPLIFTLNSHEDFSSTANSLIQGQEGVYYLWLPPDEIALLLDKISQNEGSKLVKFEGEKFGRERKFEEERRPYTKRRDSYEGEDAARTLEERKKEYGITPTELHFEWPTKGDFHFRDEGEFVLTRGDPSFFYYEIVEPVVKRVEGLNETIKASELKIVEKEGLDQITKTTLDIRLDNELDFDEAEDLLRKLEDNDFYPYSKKVTEGSLLLDGRLVDEVNGGMLSVSTDGSTLSVLPRYESRFDTLLRFFRFVIENVDPDARIEQPT